jgi:hypothetical protein
MLRIFVAMFSISFSELRAKGFALDCCPSAINAGVADDS